MTHNTEEHGPGRPRRSLGKIIPILTVFAALAGVALVATVLPKKSSDSPPTNPPPVNVTVLPVQATPQVLDTFDLTGTVEANRVVLVAAEVAGRIERILVREGQDVKAGQKMILLNTELLQAEYDRAKAQSEYDGREYQRMLAASGRGAATDTEVDQARTRRSVSQAEYEAAKTRLEWATIAAPISGRLNRVPVEEGEYVKAGDAVAELVDLEQVKVVVDVPERDVPHLKLGEPQQIFLDGGALTGQITYIGELADPQARTTPVEITVPNPPRRTSGPGGEAVRELRSGRIVRVRLTRRVLANVIMIPLAAVIPQENEQAVYVAENGTARRRVVELGFMKGWQVQVRRGLSAGDRLIVSGHRFVAPGQPVREQPPTSQPAAAGGPDVPARPDKR